MYLRPIPFSPKPTQIPPAFRHKARAGVGEERPSGTSRRQEVRQMVHAALSVLCLYSAGSLSCLFNPWMLPFAFALLLVPQVKLQGTHQLAAITPTSSLCLLILPTHRHSPQRPFDSSYLLLLLKQVILPFTYSILFAILFSFIYYFFCPSGPCSSLPLFGRPGAHQISIATNNHHISSPLDHSLPCGYTPSTGAIPFWLPTTTHTRPLRPSLVPFKALLAC